MGKGWESSMRRGRRDRLTREVLHRMANGPKPEPTDYRGCDGTHASYYMKGWNSVDLRDIVFQCQRYKEIQREREQNIQ
ncbi:MULTISPECIES: hypothetical protein [Brenneria]|uniref:Mu prophage protein n=2 Tax=Brenneria TaxID=71655 RepID=A0A421DSR8_9GAMM|nr:MULTISPECIES: hypothetical protein [Brenneria]RLM27489.1 hypothetical protein BIY29_02285 [Brenneria alni]